MISALNRALTGMQLNQQRFEQHASRISRAGLPGAGDTVDLPTGIVGTKVAQRGYEANLAVLRTADEMVGSLLDVLA